MGFDHSSRPYAFERVFALSASDPGRTSQDLGLHVLALQAELAELRRDADAALERARDDGFASGLAQARVETSNALLKAETSLCEALAALEVEFCNTEARIAALAADVSLVAAELLAARAIDQDPAAPIDAAIGRVLAQTGFRESLHLRVHPSLSAALRTLIDSRQSAEQRPLTITVHEDPNIVIGDAHITWDEGGLSLDTAARRAAVRDAMGLARE